MDEIEALVQLEPRIMYISYERESNNWHITGAGWGFSCASGQLVDVLQNLDLYM